jgi:D-alanyl-D-alanine carboxypeptidase
MGRVRSEARDGLHCSVLALAAVAAALIFTSNAAEARHARARFVRHVHVDGYAPPSASIVVDGNTGQVLQASNADALRHPASLTKIMTLYLLFERLDTGKIKLDTPLRVSEHAAEQAPTKLGLKPGQTIAVEDAIKAVVTKSANDAAVVIAENLGGAENEFAELMTQKAHALGMSRTTYVNASGLPDDDQITTARDQALLGRAIQERFPRYYRYFSTEEFVYHGSAMRNHNHLLGVVGGVDGIKTGYTRDSGFNLVTSVHRDGRYMVAVVLGGRSASERDAHMRELIAAHIKEAALHRTTTILAENSESRDQPQGLAFAKASLSSHGNPPPTAKANTAAATGSSDPIQPVLVKTVSYRTAPVQTAALAPMPALVPTADPGRQPAPATAVRTPPAAQMPEASNTILVASAGPAPIASAPKTEVPDLVEADPPKTALAKTEEASPQIRARGEWLIQVGAFANEDEAKQHLSDAQAKVPAMLKGADAFTERVQKGDKALYRARLGGFDKATAEAACKLLKRSDIACMALKN